MKYPKSPLSFEDQADLILGRGLVADRDELITLLRAVNYYRLSAYWYTFRIPNDPNDQLQPGTTLAQVWERYVFDRQLRVLTMDAIERVEIALRTQIVNRHTIAYGPFGYIDRTNLSSMRVDQHRLFMEKITREADHSREDFVRHYFKKYTSEVDLPLWMAAELLTFGGMLTLFRNVDTGIKQAIASEYGVADSVLESWLVSLNHVRNLCAHHARLWNRTLGVKPMIPRANKHPDWHAPVPITADRVFGILTVLHCLLRHVAPSSLWRARLADLFDKYPDVPKRFMGFPDNWQDSPLWQGPGRSAP